MYVRIYGSDEMKTLINIGMGFCALTLLFWTFISGVLVGMMLT